MAQQDEGNVVVPDAPRGNDDGARNIDIRTRQNTPPEALAPVDPAPDNVAQAQAPAPAQGNAAPGHAGGDAANQVTEQQAAQSPPQRRLKITVAAEEDSDDDDYEYLDKMRGWLMTVATLFVNMAFQALLHPPDWFKTEWYSGHKAGAPLASPAPSTSHVVNVTRAEAYLVFNSFAFGTAVAVAQVLLWETSYPQRTMRLVRLLMLTLSLFLICILALGTSADLTVTLIVFVFVVLYAALAVLGVLGWLGKIKGWFVKLFGRCSDNLWPFRRATLPLPDIPEA